MGLGAQRAGRVRGGGRAYAAAIVASLLLAPAIARAADDADADARKKEAQQHFDAALKLAQASDYSAALAEFRLAYGKFPSYRVLYNIAQLCAQVDDPVCAHRTYTRYLRDGGTDVTGKRRTAVESELERLSKKVGLLTITTAAPDVTIKVDGDAVGETPLPDAVAVKPGEHTVSALFEGKKVDRAITVAAGEALPITLEPPKAEPPKTPEEKPAADAKAPEPEKPREPKRGVPWVPWAAAGVLAVGTGVTAVLTAGAVSKYQDEKERFPVSKTELEDAQGKARTLFFVTGALGAATVIAAGVAGYFTWVAPKRAALVVGPGSVGLVGAF